MEKILARGVEQWELSLTLSLWKNRGLNLCIPSMKNWIDVLLLLGRGGLGGNTLAIYYTKNVFKSVKIKILPRWIHI